MLLNKTPAGTKARSGGLRYRNQSGQALVEGVISAVLIVFFLTSAVLLLVNCGMTAYYKEKLAFAVNQAAEYAYSVPSGAFAQKLTPGFLASCLEKSGVKLRNLSVKVDTNATVAGQPAVAVTASNDFNVLGNGSILPLYVRMTDVGLATSPSNVVAFAGPAGPRGSAGPQGPPGPPAAPFYDTASLYRELGIKGMGSLNLQFSDRALGKAVPYYQSMSAGGQSPSNLTLYRVGEETNYTTRDRNYTPNPDPFGRGPNAQ